MIIKSFTVNPYQENTYLLIEGKQAVVIDPGFSKASEINRMIDALESAGADLKAVLLTHAHFDHVIGVQPVIDRYEVPVYLSHADLHLWENYYSQAAFFGMDVKPFDFTPKDYPSDGNFEVAGIRMLVLPTPGHSPDHVILYLEEEGVVIAGDTLFQGSIGRTDLYKGDFKELEKSIREKLYVLPDQTRVLPGHGPETTIGVEKRSNQFVSE